MSAFLRKYATGTGSDIYIPVIKRAVVDFAVGADWTPAAGDVKVSIDGAAAANIGTLPTAVAMGNTAMWKFVFTNAELTGKSIMVTVADAATKAVEDTMFIVETYGNASALHPFDLATATQSVNVTQFGGSAGTFAAGRPEVNTTHAAGTAWGSGAITAASIAADAITDAKVAADVTIASVTGAVGSVTAAVTVGTNNDKTGYSLSAAGVQAIWDALTSALTTVGSMGKLLVDNVNATISSRSSHAAADVWSAATRVLTAGTNIVLAKGTGVTGFNDLSAAQVNAEVVDALNVDTYAEPGQGAPAATTTLVAKIGYLYKFMRNRITQTSTTLSVYADDALTVDQKATVSDNGTTYDRGEITSGP